jgi:protein SCO1
MRLHFTPNSVRPSDVTILGIALILIFLASCQQLIREGTRKGKQYRLQGTIISVDKSTGTANIDTQEIPGFMAAMVMPFRVRPANILDQVAPGDSVTADLVVDGSTSWLENVTVRARHDKDDHPAAAVHIPTRGEPVPHFDWANQAGQHKDLEQYRGKFVILTFIYTRCPFPDFCPRVTREFATLEEQLQRTPILYQKTHLLSLSFDPEHDTPKALRAYGLSYIGHGGNTFRHWEFAAVSAQQMPAVARYFGFWYEQDGGLITHSLSTAVISPDGKIVSWYHDNDWKASDLLRDVSSAMN